MDEPSTGHASLNFFTDDFKVAFKAIVQGITVKALSRYTVPTLKYSKERLAA